MMVLQFAHGRSAREDRGFFGANVLKCRRSCGKFMTDTVRQLIIQGITANGSRFRPSDWAERLAGVMSQFKPPGMASSHLTYSPYALPTVIDGVKCVVIDEKLRALEPLAWKFVVDFAKDNGLNTIEVCMLPEER